MRPPFSLRAYVDKRLPASDLDVLRLVRAQQDTSLQRARQGDVRLGELGGVDDFGPLSAQGSLVVESALESARAYLLYRLEDFDGALRCLSRAFAADLQLEQTGMVLFAAHRVQLVVNTIPISLRSGEGERATAAAATVVLVGRTRSYRPLDALESPWDAGWPRRLPRAARRPIRALGHVAVSLVERPSDAHGAHGQFLG